MNDYSEDEINAKAKRLFAKVEDPNKGNFTQEQKLAAIKGAATQQIESSLKNRLLEKLKDSVHDAYLHALSIQDESKYRHLWRQLDEIQDLERALVVLFRASKTD